MDKKLEKQARRAARLAARLAAEANEDDDDEDVGAGAQKGVPSGSESSGLGLQAEPEALAAVRAEPAAVHIAASSSEGPVGSGTAELVSSPAAAYLTLALPIMRLFPPPSGNSVSLPAPLQNTALQTAPGCLTPALHLQAARLESEARLMAESVAVGVANIAVAAEAEAEAAVAGAHSTSHSRAGGGGARRAVRRKDSVTKPMRPYYRGDPTIAAADRSAVRATVRTERGRMGATLGAEEQRRQVRPTPHSSVLRAVLPRFLRRAEC